MMKNKKLKKNFQIKMKNLIFKNVLIKIIIFSFVIINFLHQIIFSTLELKKLNFENLSFYY